MPIDPQQALGHEFPPSEASWDADRVILYHLGIGAGANATDPGELEYSYEKNLKVLPSFGVIPVFPALAGIIQVPGLKFNPALLLHGEQDITLERPIPPVAKIRNRGRVAEIWDKGKAALVVLEVESSDETGAPLFTNRFSIFLRGEGGFGGEPGPKTTLRPPSREPDAVVESPTLPQQALLYRLSGDKNPLHADPDFAKMAGFEKPILHGLCTFGVVCKAVVDAALGGDVTKVARYQTRFAGVLFPGETLVTSLWREDDRIYVAAKSRERDAPVLSNAAISLRA